MAQRLLRPAIRQSKRWNRIPYLAQTLYIRLLTLVDDYARYDADPELLTSECFPFGDPNGQPIPVPTIDGALLTLASKDMLQLYELDGKRYLQLTRWQERVRSESKWPDPKKCTLLTNDSNCCQMIASPPSPSPSPSPTPKDAIAAHRASFSAPSVDEVILAGAKTGLPESECRKFHAFYASKDWMVGKNKMKSVTHAIAGWKLRYQETHHLNGSSTPTSGSKAFDQELDSIEREIKNL